MKRSYVAIGVIGLALGVAWYSAGGSRPLAASTLQVSEPIIHENLAVFFVRGPDEVDTQKVVTLQEALERKWAIVHETGNVNTLVVENLSPDHDLFIQSGDMIKGGRQDRMIASDMLLEPASGKIPVGVHCVEHNRWTGRGTEAASHFAVSDNYAVGSSLKLANASGNQSAVWANVSVNQERLTSSLGVQVNAVESPSSLQLALENSTVKSKVQDYRRVLGSAGGKRGVIGAVFVINGKVSSAEMYGSNTLFQKAWPKLLKAASIEALAEKPTTGSTRTPAVQEVEEYLAMGGKAVEGDVAINSSQQMSGLMRDDLSRNTQRYGFQSLRELGVGQVAGGQVPLTGSVGLGNFGGLGDTSLNWTGQTAVNPSQTQAPNGSPQPQSVRLDASSANSLSNSSGRNPTSLLSNLTPHPGVHQPQTMNPSPPQAGRNNLSQALTANAVDNVFAVSEPLPSPTPPGQPINPLGNRLTCTSADNGSTLLLESRESGKKVIHRSYITK